MLCCNSKEIYNCSSLWLSRFTSWSYYCGSNGSIGRTSGKSLKDAVLLIIGSILKLTLRLSIGKQRLFPIGTKQSSRCSGLVWQKTCNYKQNPKKGALRWFKPKKQKPVFWKRKPTKVLFFGVPHECMISWNLCLFAWMELRVPTTQSLGPTIHALLQENLF